MDYIVIKFEIVAWHEKYLVPIHSETFDKVIPMRYIKLMQEKAQKGNLLDGKITATHWADDGYTLLCAAKLFSLSDVREFLEANKIHEGHMIGIEGTDVQAVRWEIVYNGKEMQPGAFYEETCVKTEKFKDAKIPAREERPKKEGSIYGL